MKSYISSLIIILQITFFGLCCNAQESSHPKIEGSNGKLYTILQYPEQVQENVKYPLVILCHGFGGNCESTMQNTLASDLINEGIAVMRFDFNGHGKSQGEFQNMTIDSEIQDLKNVIAWAQSQPWVESISLTGYSQGGVVVGIVAGELGTEIISSEVLIAPAGVLKEDALKGYIMGAKFDPWNLQQEYYETAVTAGEENLKLGRDYIVSALNLQIYEPSSKYEGPSLIVQGTHDRLVPYTYSVLYNSILKGSELKLIEGDDHWFTNSFSEMCKYVSSWFKEVLKPAPVNPVRI